METIRHLEDFAMIPDPNTEEFLLPGHLIQCSNRNEIDLYRVVLQMAMNNFLSSKDHEVIYLRYWEQLSKTDIGKRLGMTPSAVCKRLAKAEMRLKDHIDFCFEVYETLKKGGYRQNQTEGGQKNAAHATAIAIGG